MTIKQRKRLGIFCGASPGKDERYALLAEELGDFMVSQGWDLVYGGASVGLMGMMANAVLRRGGQVFGVIPQFMIDVELAHRQLTQLDVVDSMHERKFRMYQLSDGFLALPGGIGTLDELFEILTWGQLGRHQKPCALWNRDQYFHHQLQQLQVMVQEGFLQEHDLKRLQVFQQVSHLVSFLSSGASEKD